MARPKNDEISFPEALLFADTSNASVKEKDFREKTWVYVVDEHNGVFMFKQAFIEKHGPWIIVYNKADRPAVFSDKTSTVTVLKEVVEFSPPQRETD